LQTTVCIIDIRRSSDMPATTPTPIRQREHALADAKALDRVEDAQSDRKAAVRGEGETGSKYEAALASVQGAHVTKLAPAKRVNKKSDPKPAAKAPKTKAAKKPAAKTKPASGPRVSKLGNVRTASWTDKTGREIVVGATVIEPERGTVKSRCTRPEKDGTRTPMIGVATSKPYTRGGRTVKVPTFVATECLLKK
jgi:hypothetical protein